MIRYIDIIDDHYGMVYHMHPVVKLMIPEQLNICTHER